MKKFFRYALMIFAGAAVAASSSCSSESSSTGGASEGLALRVGTNMDDLVIKTYSTDNSSDIVEMADVDEFKVTLIDNATQTVKKVWERYADMPPVAEVEKGSYTLIVESPTQQSAGYDTPYFRGEDTQVGIISGQLKKVDLVCKLANVATYVVFDESFTNQLNDCSLSIAKANASADQTMLVFTPSGSERYGFFSVGPLKVTAKGYSKATGNPLSTTLMIDQTNANELHRFTVKAIESGEAELNIVVDGSTVDVDHDVVIPDEGGDFGDGSDFGDGDDPWDDGDTEPGGAPTITGRGFDISSPLVIKTADANTTDVIVDMKASEGVKNLFVEIDSPYLTEEILAGFGIPVSFDLANLNDPTLEEAFISLGLIESADITGKTSVSFSIGAFMSLLDINTHKFHIRLVDQKDQEASATLTIDRVD